MSNTKPKCVKGTACGYTCINGKYTCSSKILKRDADALIKSVTNTAVKAEPPSIEPWEDWGTLGQGEFGEAILTDRGTVVKVIKEDAGEFTDEDPVVLSRREYDMMVVMEDLSIGPKALGFDSKTGDIEMSYLKGETFETGYKYASDQDKATLAANAYEAVTKLHKAGYSHNDFHFGNAMFDKDLSVTIIDAGMAGKVGEASDKHVPFKSGFSDVGMLFRNLGRPADKYYDSLEDKLEVSGVLEKYRAMRDESYDGPDPFSEPKAEVLKQRGDAERYLHSEYLKLI